MNTPTNRKVLYALILTIVAVLAVGVNSILYANHEANKAQRAAAANTELQLQNLCGFVVVIDDAYTQTPPATPGAIRFAAEIHHLRSALHCDQHSPPGVSAPASASASAAPVPTPDASTPS